MFEDINSFGLMLDNDSFVCKAGNVFYSGYFGRWGDVYDFDFRETYICEEFISSVVDLFYCRINMIHKSQYQRKSFYTRVATDKEMLIAKLKDLKIAKLSDHALRTTRTIEDIMVEFEEVPEEKWHYLANDIIQKLEDVWKYNSKYCE